MMFRKFDSIVFNGFFYRSIISIVFSLVHSGRLIKLYHVEKYIEFSKLCDKYGSDKGSLLDSSDVYPWKPNGYSTFYEMEFAVKRNIVLNVFECGLGTNNVFGPSSMGRNGRPGASLRVWRDYFMNANIVGGDVDQEILFEENRIATGYLDQESKGSIQSFWEKFGKVEYDLMVDDGLHTFNAGKTLYENSRQHLSKTGIYVIEDIPFFDLLKWKIYLHEINQKYSWYLIKTSKTLINWVLVFRK